MSCDDRSRRVSAFVPTSRPENAALAMSACAPSRDRMGSEWISKRWCSLNAHVFDLRDNATRQLEWWPSMRDGLVRRSAKWFALRWFYATLGVRPVLARAAGRSPFVLGGDCQRCAKCCEEPAIRVELAHLEDADASARVLVVAARVNGFELWRAIARRGSSYSPARTSTRRPGAAIATNPGPGCAATIRARSSTNLTRSSCRAAAIAPSLATGSACSACSTRRR